MICPRTRRVVGYTCSLLVLALAAAACGPPASEAVAEVRARYFARDYAGAFGAASDLVEKHPENPELRAWQVLAAAQSRRHDFAIAQAEMLQETVGPWGHFALAGALRRDPSRGQEALEASERALSALPMHPDLVWMRAQTLATFGDPVEAIALVDDQTDPTAEQLNVKAYALFVQSFGPSGDPGKLDEALEAYEQARRLDGTNVNASYMAGDMLQRRRRNPEARLHLEEALRLSPRSAEIHAAYWHSVLGLPDLSPEDKRALIEADVEALLNSEADVPSALLVIEGIYAELGETEREREFEERLLREHPDRPEAESVLIGRFRALRPAAADEDATREQHSAYRDALRDFIALPMHHRTVFIGEAYLNLFLDLADDPEADSDELARVISGMVEHERLNPHLTYARGAVVLAQRTHRYREAERIARAGIEAVPDHLESRRRLYDTEGDYENELNYALAVMHDALGEVFYAEGRLDDAESAFSEGHELNPRNRDNLHHLGQLAEARGQLEEAESFFVKGLAVQGPGDNPNRPALERLYVERAGDASGFDAYITAIERADRAGRKSEILEARIADPRAAPTISLRDLEGKTWQFGDFAGKVVVVNFWGIWCGWCVTEMPELQKLHETFADDPGVVVLTINNDPNPDDVEPWMRENGYTFPVLLDDGYVDGASVHVFPTTWFLDRQGRIAFDKQGWSQELFEEFVWRIEELRSE